MTYDENEIEPESEMSLLAQHLEDEVPYENCSRLWQHTGWLDLVQTLKNVSPAAYAALVQDLVKK